jgi:hypothetical protein
VNGGDARNRLHHVLRRDVVLVVTGAEMACGDACVFHLVITLRIESDRVCPCGLSGDFPEHACERGAVGAAA